MSNSRELIEEGKAAKQIHHLNQQQTGAVIIIKTRPTGGQAAQMTTASSEDRHNLKFSDPKSAYNSGSNIQYCKICGQLITLQYFELVRVLHPYSMFNWQRVTTTRWMARDYFEPSKRHTHRHRQRAREGKGDEGGAI